MDFKLNDEVIFENNKTKIIKIENFEGRKFYRLEYPLIWVEGEQLDPCQEKQV